MIYEGQSLAVGTVCQNCGNRADNKLPHTSAFIRYSCQSKDCEARGVLVTIEKCSNTVFSVYPPFIIDGKYAWPKVAEFTDVDGKVIWPLPDPPAQTHTDR